MQTNFGKFSPSAIKQFGDIRRVTRFIKINGFGDVRESTVKDPYGETFYAVPITRYGVTIVTVKDSMETIMFCGEFGKSEYPEMSKKELKLWYDRNGDVFKWALNIAGMDHMSLDVTADDGAQREAALRGVIPLPVNPETLSKTGSEHGEQTALFCVLNYLGERWFPDLKFAYANGNGGSRGDTEKSRKIAGGMMKAEGVKPGVPDITVPIPRQHVGSGILYAGLYIELKTKEGGDGGSDNQKKYIEFLNRMGYKAVLCNGWKEALQQIRNYLEI